MNYVMRQGRRIEVVTINTGAAPPKKRRRSFLAIWVKLPRHWITALRQSRSVHTYELALTILMEAYERQTDTITLSRQLTRGMSRATKTRAAEELEKFGLIQIKREPGKVFKVAALLGNL